MAFLFVFSLWYTTFFLLGQGDKKGLIVDYGGPLLCTRKYRFRGPRSLRPDIAHLAVLEQGLGQKRKRRWLVCLFPPSVGPVGSGRKSWGQKW